MCVHIRYTLFLFEMSSHKIFTRIHPLLLKPLSQVIEEEGGEGGGGFSHSFCLHLYTRAKDALLAFFSATGGHQPHGDVSPSTILLNSGGGVMLLQAVSSSKPPTVFSCPRVEGIAGDFFSLGCVIYLLLEERLPYGIDAAPTVESLRESYLSQPTFTPGAYGNIELEGLVRSLLLTPEIVVETLMRGAHQGLSSASTLTLDDDVLDSIGVGSGSKRGPAPPPSSRGASLPKPSVSSGGGSGGGGGVQEGGESKEAQRLARLARMRSSAAQEGEEEALRLVRMEAHAERVRLKALAAGGGGVAPPSALSSNSAPVVERPRPAALSRTPPKGSPTSSQGSFERVRGHVRVGDEAEVVEEEAAAAGVAEAEDKVNQGTPPSSSAILQLRAAKLERKRAEEEAALGAARIAAFQGRLALAAKAKDQYSGSSDAAPALSLPHSGVSSTASSVISEGSLGGGGGGRRDTPSPLVFPPPSAPLSGPSLASQLRAERLRKATEEEEEQLRKARVVAHNERLLLKQKAVGYI